MSCVARKSCPLQIELLLLWKIANGYPNCRELFFLICTSHVKIYPTHRIGQEVEFSEKKRSKPHGLGKMCFNLQVLLNCLLSHFSCLNLTGNIVLLMVKSPRVHTSITETLILAKEKKVLVPIPVKNNQINV